MDIAYKIQLFDHISKSYIGVNNYYLWFNHSKFESILKELEQLKQSHIIPINFPILPRTTGKYDRAADMNLFKANVLYNKLVKLGVDCQIVEISYSE